MGGIARKAAARFMALAAVFMFALGFCVVASSQQAQAADKGDIQNVVISPEGLLSWDAFEGAGSYYYSVSGTGAGFGGRLDYSECPVDLYEECMYYHCPSGTFNVSLVARQNSDWPYGDEVSNTWRGTYAFTRPAGPTHTVSFDSNGGSGTMAPMTAEDDAKFTLPPCTLTPPEGCTFRAWLVNGEEMKEYYTFICTEDTTVKALWKYPPQDIQNVKISPTGILTWDPYEGAGIYSLGIFNYGSMIEKSSTSVDLYQICQDRGFSPDQDYDVCFYAEENDSWPYGEEVSLRWYGSYRYQEFPALVLCDGEHYFVNADRTLVANTWKKIDGYWYFFNDDGTMAKSTWKKDSKGWCYVGEDGKMLTNGWAKDGKGWCWVDSSGYMATVTKWIKVDGSWYHITKGYRDASKWMKDSKGWCYLGEDGVMLTNGFAKDGKGWCYIGSNGYMVTATKWIKVDGYWYHITKGYRDASKWMKDSKGWCWLQADGKMLTNGWATDSKGYCWIGADGYMVVANKWVQYEGEWYYIEKGYMATSKWKKDSTGWCYLGTDGRICKEMWIRDSKGFCWVGSDGYMVEGTGWIEYGPYKYYIIDNYMVTGYVEIDGETYHFDSDGKLIP